ncbi:MAG: hypothetical protein H8K04_06435 [Nitrospira sp.]
MADKESDAPETYRTKEWSADNQSLLDAMLAATPTQRIAWLEEALQLAYATGALKPRRMMTQEEWDAMGSSSE